MKKKTINAFTLVVMLIVIVIIGILIAALMPRMQSAQGRARDVSRKTALSQIQSAIVTSQWDKWRWPGMGSDADLTCDDSSDSTCNSSASDAAAEWINVSAISSALKAAGMNSIPKDPLDWTTFYWIGTSQSAEWQYRYIVTKRNWTDKWWFALMAKTEVEWWSNWLYCGWDSAPSGSASSRSDWVITSETDVADPDQVSLCTSFKKVDASESPNCELSLGKNADGVCTYSADSQLRYLLVY